MRALIASLALVAACSPRATVLRVTVDVDHSLEVDQVRFWISAGGSSRTPAEGLVFPEPARRIATGETVTFAFPEDDAGNFVDVTVEGRWQGQAVFGPWRVPDSERPRLVKDELVPLVVKLSRLGVAVDGGTVDAEGLDGGATGDAGGADGPRDLGAPSGGDAARGDAPRIDGPTIPPDGGTPIPDAAVDAAADVAQVVPDTGPVAPDLRPPGPDLPPDGPVNEIPQRLKVYPGHDFVTVTWDRVPGSSGYRVYWQYMPGVTLSTRFSNRSHEHENYYVVGTRMTGVTAYARVSTNFGTRESDLSVEVSGTAAPQPERPSCTPYEGTAVCGASRNGDCCHDNFIWRAYFPRLINDLDLATVMDFRLDTYEVTVGRFRRFVEAGLGTRANPPAPGAGAHFTIPGSGWDPAWNRELPATTADLRQALSSCGSTWTDTPKDDYRPMGCVTWYEAFAFCAWDRARLPTFAEHNYVSTGRHGYHWPWGEREFDYLWASYWVDDTKQCYGDELPGCAITDFVRPGLKERGLSDFGQHDLGGNMREWVLDWAQPRPTPCYECAQLTTNNPAAGRIIRGGGYKSTDVQLRNDYEDALAPGARVIDAGFRCARNP